MPSQIQAFCYKILREQNTQFNAVCGVFSLSFYAQIYTHTHTHTSVFILGYMLLVDVMEVPASNLWNILTHTLTDGVCVLQCPKDVEVQELQHTMDFYMWLGVMMPLLLTIAPDFLPVSNGKIFLFIHYLFRYLFFSEMRRIFKLPNVVFQISVNSF